MDDDFGFGAPAAASSSSSSNGLSGISGKKRSRKEFNGGAGSKKDEAAAGGGADFFGGSSSNSSKNKMATDDGEDIGFGSSSSSYKAAPFADADGDGRGAGGKKKGGGKSGGFQSMGLSEAIIGGVLKMGYKVPTPIQRKALPIALSGRDLVAMARTGSGKTAAFLIPLLERLKTHSSRIGARAVVLSPTRELAYQTLKFAMGLAKYTALRFAAIVGGESMEEQFSLLSKNPDVIIATPGRLWHLLMEVPTFNLKACEFVVFDEADRLFEMGFADQLTAIIGKLPAQRQALLFSATLPKALVQFAKIGLKDPELIRLDADTKVSENLKLAFFTIRKEEKPAALLWVVKNLLPDDSQQAIVFVSTRHHTEFLTTILKASGISAEPIYGQMDQTARTANLAAFRARKIRILLVTDVAARGIDIPLLDNVINYDFPDKPKLFVHRAGRVARQGRSGTAFSFVQSGELPYLLDLLLFLGHGASNVFTPSSLTDGDGSSSSSSSSSNASGSRGYTLESMRPSDVHYGQLPRSSLEQEIEIVGEMMRSNKSDLQAMAKTVENALQLYNKTKAEASRTSSARAHGLPDDRVHPLLLSFEDDGELKRRSFVAGLQAFRPSQTIMEVDGKPQKTAGAQAVLNAKRKFHAHAVAPRIGSVSLNVAAAGVERGNADIEALVGHGVREAVADKLAEAIPGTAASNKKRQAGNKDKKRMEEDDDESGESDDDGSDDDDESDGAGHDDDFGAGHDDDDDEDDDDDGDDSEDDDDDDDENDNGYGGSLLRLGGKKAGKSSSAVLASLMRPSSSSSSSLAAASKPRLSAAEKRRAKKQGLSASQAALLAASSTSSNSIAGVTITNADTGHSGSSSHGSGSGVMAVNKKERKEARRRAVLETAAAATSKAATSSSAANVATNTRTLKTAGVADPAAAFRDQQHYISHAPEADRIAEAAYGASGTVAAAEAGGNSDLKDLARFEASTFDLMSDDRQGMNQARKVRYWDTVKKKFLWVDPDELKNGRRKKPAIRNEAGVIIKDGEGGKGGKGGKDGEHKYGELYRKWVRTTRQQVEGGGMEDRGGRGGHGGGDDDDDDDDGGGYGGGRGGGGGGRSFGRPDIDGSDAKVVTFREKKRDDDDDEDGGRPRKRRKFSHGPGGGRDEEGGDHRGGGGGGGKRGKGKGGESDGTKGKRIGEELRSAGQIKKERLKKAKSQGRLGKFLKKPGQGGRPGGGDKGGGGGGRGGKGSAPSRSKSFVKGKKGGGRGGGGGGGRGGKGGGGRR